MKSRFHTDNTDEALQIFLCHGKEDKDTVRGLYRRLKAGGMQPWLDEENIDPGMEWNLAIKKAVRRCNVILVCLSRTSIQKTGYVQREIAMALDYSLEKPRGTQYIIPLRLEECEVPEHLAHLQWIDLFRTNSYKCLENALRRIASKQESGDSLTPTSQERITIPKNARVELIFPKQGSVVERIFDCSAITENLPKRFEKWMLVYADGAQMWFPREVNSEEARWTQQLIVGSTHCNGASFKVLLFITNRKGSEYLRRCLEGTRSLPSGYAIEVSVRRAH